ncbi:hypothetical protein INT45_002402 [Circinella minor]|uniref:Uncharacterized protein n=1 Tax=Circinella minor TaxID=1195481 RepID=A0A8H7RX70_9FUNG|nr:hypothetical protein INT45_002402 [Circinella minor]
MPSAKKKQQQQQQQQQQEKKQSNDTNKHSNTHNNNKNNTHGTPTFTDTTTTTTITSNNKLQLDMAQEQSQLYQELMNYITRFRNKVKKKSTLLSNQELIILFVMHLHSRWKRLVEPEEYRFKDWEEAAKVAQYHAIKYSVLLNAERRDQDPMFTSKEAKKVLSSGYFKPSPSSSSWMDNVTQKESNDSKIINNKSKTTTTTENQHNKKEIPNVHNGTQSIVQENTSTVKEQQQSSSSSSSTDKKEQQSSSSSSSTDKKEQQSSSSSPSTDKKEQQSSSSSSSIDKKEQQQDTKKKKKQEEKETSFLTHTQQRGKLIIPPGANKKSVCYKIPSAHKNVNLPFIDLSINGQRVRRCLLAKKRWGASAMSVALQEDLKLKLNRQDACDIATEFGQVSDAIGSVLCLIQHPTNASMESELTIQVMPALYGGQVDLILGADFFFFFGAFFKLKQSMIHFMGYDAPFYADTFE